MLQAAEYLIITLDVAAEELILLAEAAQVANLIQELPTIAIVAFLGLLFCDFEFVDD